MEKYSGSLGEEKLYQAGGKEGRVQAGLADGRRGCSHLHALDLSVCMSRLTIKSTWYSVGVAWILKQHSCVNGKLS